MKTNIKFIGLALIALIAGVSSCDKVIYPNVIITDLDTTIFPGSFIDYDYPTFEENTNTLRNVLIEDFTGHKCPFCPIAAAEGKDISEANPDRVFIATIHAGPTTSGSSNFQTTDEAHTRDFTTPEGLEMGSTFFQASVGFSSNPSGTVNRVQSDDGDGVFFFNHDEWGALTTETMTSTLDVNLQAKSTYFNETNGVFLHVETEFINELEGNYNIVVYAIENEIIAPQKGDGTVFESEIEDYEHHSVHIGNLYNETWGRLVASGTTEAGSKFQNDFSYSLTDGLTPTNMHFLVILFNRDTYEIMQVIKHEF